MVAKVAYTKQKDTRKERPLALLHCCGISFI